MFTCHKISRISFNFRGSCNSTCPFCYIPFVDANNGDIVIWKKVVDAILTFQPDVITIGGGEPFCNEGFTELLKYISQKGCAIHVDSNASHLSYEAYSAIDKYIDIIALPLDGIGVVHDKFRNWQGHYELVLQKIGELSKLNVKVRINTIVHKHNYHQLIEIAKLIRFQNIAQWQLYEYWFFPEVNVPPTRFDNKEINKLLPLLSKESQKTVEYSPVSQREKTYFFVSSIGKMYGIVNGNKYIEYGDIWDESALDNAIKNTNFTENELRAQKKILL
ncbi:4Fe-4S single cluster protein [Kineothrix alysoides]|uniref:4Fe-4S single cluster protein n=1 Tax=Kineothrix alysoides TaxID=1469948 RepID=A0A4R1QY88_9FIRM|nr:radical SAM protein [Kineothrix alysoides]TCL56970.1 4Fe-4S single cluster protein [Kineothrix alysoides]